MITFTDDRMQLLIYTWRELYAVTAICNTDEEANAYCAANPGEGVIAEDRQHGRVYIAAEGSVTATIRERMDGKKKKKNRTSK